jgi:hypothetical protein
MPAPAAPAHRLAPTNIDPHTGTQDLLEYKKKHRTLRVKMMDDTVKTVLVDDSNTVHDLVIAVCQKIGAVLPLSPPSPLCPTHPPGLTGLGGPGIASSDEYSFTTEKLEEAAKQAAVRKTTDPKAAAKSDSMHACMRVRPPCETHWMP